MTTSSSRKKVAICISGLVRTYRETYESFVNSLLKPNQHCDIDIFISTWDIELSNNSMERTRRQAWYGDNTPAFPENPIDYNDIKNKYNPVSITIEKSIIFDESWYVSTPGVNIQSLLSMTYKIYSCDKLRRDRQAIYGKYDTVIRTRFDCLYSNEFVVGDSYEAIVTPSMMQPKPFEDRDWVNDKFAIGNEIDMTIYSDWYINFVRLIKNGIPIQPETLLAAHLNENNVRYSPFGDEMQLVRPAGF